MWRSARCKRAVNSTLAGETIAMSSTLAGAERAQIMIQDILDQAATVRDTPTRTLPFQVVLHSNCTLSKQLPHDHSIDAKSAFDALIKECAGSRQDRRQRNTQGSRLSHSLDPTSTHACRLDEGRPVRREQCIETLATHWKAGLGRRDNSNESALAEPSSQSSAVGS